MSVFSPVTLATSRLTLRFLSAADRDPLFALFSDPETMRYWSSAPWEQAQQAAACIEDTLSGYEQGSMLRLGMELDGQLAGTVTLYAFDRQNKRCDIGYLLGRQYWGRGYMQEALQCVLDYAFGPLQLRRIEADIDPRNTASAKLLTRLRFQHEGHLRERWLVNGEVCDSDVFGLLRADWLAVQ
jgi:ribosomal-protein-alanine N-acetyltransferase